MLIPGLNRAIVSPLMPVLTQTVMVGWIDSMWCPLCIWPAIHNVSLCAIRFSREKNKISQQSHLAHLAIEEAETLLHSSNQHSNRRNFTTIELWNILVSFACCTDQSPICPTWSMWGWEMAVFTSLTISRIEGLFIRLASFDVVMHYTSCRLFSVSFYQ